MQEKIIKAQPHTGRVRPSEKLRRMVAFVNPRFLFFQTPHGLPLPFPSAVFYPALRTGRAFGTYPVFWLWCAAGIAFCARGLPAYDCRTEESAALPFRAKPQGDYTGDIPISH